MPADLQKMRSAVQKYGWVVQGVSDLACECDHDDAPIAHTGRDPYLYTIGLTAAGLPELLLQLTGRNSLEWIGFGTRILNVVAQHTLHRELAVGETLPLGLRNLNVTVQQPPLVDQADGFWPGFAYALYGADKVRVLEVCPDW